MSQINIENPVFINSSKEQLIYKIRNNKVYNIGPLVKILYLFFANEKKLYFKIYNSYKILNTCILYFLPRHTQIFIPCFYASNSLSIIFSKYRQNVKLIEVQHGSIINYPPYKIPAPFKIIDKIFVRNHDTIIYLKNNLCSRFNCDFTLIPPKTVIKKHKNGLNVLYASSVELNGFHPVFMSFLQSYAGNIKLNLTIRLHPREIGKRNLFVNFLEKNNIDYFIDESKDWLDQNCIENLIVVSPWSSILEEAYRYKFISITIDEIGRSRYESLIDNKNFFYTENLQDLLNRLWL